MLANKEERKKIEFLKDEQKANAIRELTTWKMEKNHQPDKTTRNKSKAG